MVLLAEKQGHSLVLTCNNGEEIDENTYKKQLQ